MLKRISRITTSDKQIDFPFVSFIITPLQSEPLSLSLFVLISVFFPPYSSALRHFDITGEHTLDYFYKS